MTLLLLLSGCMEFELPAGNFEVPRAVAVLQPEVGGPFEEPIGFVANEIGGQIVPLALKQGRPLTDDPTASFLPANQLPTGDRRLLSSVAVYAPARDRVTLFAGDRAFAQLLRIPYIVPCEGADSIVGYCEPGLGEVTAPGGVRASGKLGWTTRETWTFTPGATGTWTAEGSRSGRQPDLVRRAELPWSALDRRLQIEAIPARLVGEPFTVETRSPLVEYDLGGIPLALEMAPDQSALAVVIRDPDTDEAGLYWVDPVALADGDPPGAVSPVEVTLPDGAEPHRLSVSEGGGLLVADAARSAFYEVSWGADDAVEHVMPWPTLDVAGLVVGESNVRFVVPLEGSSLWRYDADAGELLDVNAAQPGVQGIAFDATVQGIEAMPLPYRTPQLDVDQERVVTRAVAVSLQDGRTVFAHEDTGCLVQNRDGPQTAIASSPGSAATDIDTNGIEDEISFLARFAVPLDGDGNRVIVNRCAGIALSETWAVTYDEIRGTWEVEGSLSGVQANRVVEGERYVSDEGAMSFLLEGGATPSRDGWQFTFTVASGVATATGDSDGDVTRDVDLSVSGDPAFFYYRVGKVGPVTAREFDEMMDADNPDLGFNSAIRPFVLVPGGATNRVGRVDPSDDLAPIIEASWE